MAPDAKDELILRHLDGETTADELKQVTRLLSDDPQFRSRFSIFVSLVAQLRDILDSRLRDSHSPVNGTSTVGEFGMSTQPAITAKPPAAGGAARPAGGLLADLNLDLRRVYFNALVAGFGGLLAWVVMVLLDMTLGGVFRAITNTFWQTIVRSLIIGPALGVCIGFAVGGTEGLLASRSMQRMFKGGGYGAALGAVGGLIGMPLGELLFNVAISLNLPGGILFRSLGWGLFGMFVGTSDGVANRVPEKIRYGVLGGLLGGLIGGATYEGLNAFLGSLGFRAGGRAWGSAVGLVILAACIGFMISLVETLLRKAWVFFLTGRLEGQTRTLDSSRPHTLGSSPACVIVLPGDPTVRPVHAEIAFADGDFHVRPRDGEVVVRRDGFDQTITSHKLEPQDRILLGDTRMVFRNVEGRKIK